MVTKGKTLVNKRMKGKENESKAAMPQRVKQKGWAKSNQLPAGPRKKRRLCRRLFPSICKFLLHKISNSTSGSICCCRL